MNQSSANEMIVKEITIKASAERIFEALTDPRQLPQWWGAEGRFQATHMESELRVGGKWMMRGVGMGGKAFRIEGEYRIIQRPRSIAFTWLPDWNSNMQESLVRFDLDEKHGVTTVRLTHSNLTSEGARANRGWPDILEWLRAYCETKTLAG